MSSIVSLSHTRSHQQAPFKQAQGCENKVADSLVRQEIYRKGERDGKYAGRMSLIMSRWSNHNYLLLKDSSNSKHLAWYNSQYIGL